MFISDPNSETRIVMLASKLESWADLEELSQAQECLKDEAGFLGVALDFRQKFSRAPLAGYGVEFKINSWDTVDSFFEGWQRRPPAQSRDLLFHNRTFSAHNSHAYQIELFSFLNQTIHYKQPHESAFSLVAASLSEHPNLVDQKRVSSDDYSPLQRFYEQKLRDQQEAGKDYKFEEFLRVGHRVLFVDYKDKSFKFS